MEHHGAPACLIADIVTMGSLQPDDRDLSSQLILETSEPGVPAFNPAHIPIFRQMTAA
jgi:hypothetical protein